MEDITLALVTLTSFVLLFVVALFADHAGSELITADQRDSRGDNREPWPNDRRQSGSQPH